MRISDWSSDVCSSDLDIGRRLAREQQRLLAVGGMLDEEILAREMEGQQFGERGVVLDQQHSGGGHASVSFYSVTAGLPPRSRSAMRSPVRSEAHTSELQSLMRLSYAVFCLKKKKKTLTVEYP